VQSSGLQFLYHTGVRGSTMVGVGGTQTGEGYLLTGKKLQHTWKHSLMPRESAWWLTFLFLMVG